MSNYLSSFHVIDLKLDIEPSLPVQAQCSGPTACHAVECNDEYLSTGGRRGLP